MAQKLGALDFAGGTVIHISAGVAALAAALALPKRRGYGQQPLIPYNITITLLGAILLWFGWFGFNGGSALSAGPLAVHAIVTTNVAAAAAGVMWMILSGLKARPSITGVATGVVVGLVAITPACGFVDLPAAMLIGALGSVVSFYAIRLMHRFKVDDSLDVFACHGVAGMWGALATGLFATTAVNLDGANGLLLGNIELFNAQVVSVVVASLFSFVGTYGLVWLIQKVRGFTVASLDEEIGLDIAQHGESAFKVL